MHKEGTANESSPVKAEIRGFKYAMKCAKNAQNTRRKHSFSMMQDVLTNCDNKSNVRVL